MKCRYCKNAGLVLSMANADYSCEYCGEWQNAELGSIWEIIGYKCEECGESHELENELMTLKGAN